MSYMLRDAQLNDLPQIMSIFNQVIATGNIIYQERPFSTQDMGVWFNSKKEKGYPVIVCEHRGQVVGFGACSIFREKECYKTTSELAVHIDEHHRGRGLGKQIINMLLEKSNAQGIHSVVACIDSANTNSISLHEKLGFRVAGTMKQVARKNNQWLDLVILEKLLN